MRIFLSASYGRRLELCGYRDELIEMGHEVTSRWLAGPDVMLELGGQPIRLGAEAEKAIEDGIVEGAYRGPEIMRKLAQIDLEDNWRSNCLINFTEAPNSGIIRGGRHVELGTALGTNRIVGGLSAISLLTRIVVVGYRENLFHWLPCVEFAETWEKAKGLL